MFEVFPDRQVGETFIINGKDAYQTFEADLISFVVTPGAITTETHQDPASPAFRCYSHKLAPKIVTVSLFVHGDTFDQLEINKSNLLEECRQCVLKTGDMTGLEYDSVLTSALSEETGIDCNHKVTLDFTSIQRGVLQTVTLRASGTVNNPGNAPSPCRYTITAASALSSFTINGITVTGIKKNTPFVIDGILGKVTENGENKWDQTDLVSFPALLPGENSITFSPAASVKVEYYPLYR